MTRKQLAFSLTLLLAIPLLAAVPQQEKTAEILLGAALHQEEVEGNLEAAIATYEKILTEHSTKRALAARAQLHIGICYEKLGKPEAREAYERLLRNYADQAEQVYAARTRLAALDQPRSPADPSTMVVRRVWSGGDATGAGGVSPGGHYLSYRTSGGGLAIHDLESGKDRPLSNKDSWSRARGSVTRDSNKLSPDGKQVAYVWHNRGSFNDVRIVGLDGSKPRVLYRNEEVSRTLGEMGREHIVPRAVRAWSPDGKYILVMFRRVDLTNQIGLLSVADGSVRVLKTLDWRTPGWVSFSPDGRYIAYDLAKEDSPGHDIFLLATDGSRETPLIEHPAHDQWPVWAPDGKRILFVSDRTRSRGAWLIQVADGKPRGSPELVKPDIGSIRPLGFTRNGSFYYRLAIRMEDVYTATLDLAAGKLLSSPEKVSQPFVGSNLRPDWSPDGQYLAYFSLMQGPEPIRASVVIRSVETGEVRELPPQRLYKQYYRGLRWSPDGRSILIKGSDDKGRYGLYQLNAQTGAVTPIVQTTGSGGSRPEYSPDGRAIFYWRGGSRGPTRIVARDLESGEERDLLRVVPPSYISHIMVVSPNGQRLAFFMEDSDTQSMALKVMPTAGGEPRELLRVHRPDFFNLGNYSALAWTTDGRELIFGKRTAASGTKVSPGDYNPNSWSYGKVELWRISADGGATQSVGLAMNRLSHLRFHPDGRRIVFDAVDAIYDEVWVMEHFLPELSATK